jgi:hypothetical protein
MFCSDPLESVHGGSKARALGRSKTCARVFAGHNGYGLRYLGHDEVKLQGCINLDWADNAVDRKSTLECNFNLGSTIISWFNEKKTFVELSSTEVEYMVASMASCESIWLRKLLARMFDQELDSTVIYYDNQSCIKL